MGRIAVSLLAGILFICAAHGAEFDDEEAATPYRRWSDYDDEPFTPTAIIIIITVVLLIKAAIISCCCLFCRASPIYRWCHGDSSTRVTIIHPPSSYPGTIGQNNFSFSLPPQPAAVVQDDPPQYSRVGDYNRLVTPMDSKPGYNP